MVDFDEVCAWLYKLGFDLPVVRHHTSGGAFIFRKGIGYRKKELLIVFGDDRKIPRSYFEKIKADALKL